MLINYLKTETAMLNLGGRLARAITEQGVIIFLYGQLGVGKTTLVRGFLRELGFQGHVKSPTYTLVESYPIADKHIFHFDLYRIKDSAELEYIGIQDYFSASALCLVEWPEQGVGVLPMADLSCYIEMDKASSRTVKLEAQSVLGNIILGRLQDEKA